MPITAASLLSRIHTVPTIPKVVQELIATFDAPQINVPRIARLVNTDPVLSAKVLRLANSAYYHRSRSVVSVNEAIVFMGLDALRMLVIGAGFAACVPVPQSLGRNLFWRYCLHTAVCAKFIAEQAGEAPQAAFTAGLLHAIGEPLMVTALASELADIERSARFYDHERAGYERSQVGFAFSDLGAALADSWHFPEHMVEAIRYAPEPLAATSFSRLAACVYVGSHFAGGIERREDNAMSLMTLDVRVLDELGVSLEATSQMPPVGIMAEGLKEMVA